MQERARFGELENLAKSVEIPAEDLKIILEAVRAAREMGILGIPVSNDDDDEDENY